MKENLLSTDSSCVVKIVTSSKISILGCGVGRFGAALLAKKHNFEVFVSDKNLINQDYKDKFIAADIPFEESKNSINKIFPCDILIKSPGIPLDNEIINLAQQQNIPILDEIAFAAPFTNAKLIGITGSNGKSTLAYMVYKILKDVGKKVEICGNMGKSLALAIVENHDVDFFVIELSSFQLEFFNQTHLDIACIVNISENHIDHHKNFENYVAAKLNIARGLTANDYFIFNGEDKNISVDTPAQKIAVGHADVVKFDKNLLQVEGEHNIFDALLAIKIGMACGIDEAICLEILKDYKSLPHRIEFVAEVDGLTFFDDSKATTIGAAEVALDFVVKKFHHGKIIWLAGGGDKGNDYTKLLKFVPYFRKIICIGKDNEKILQTFGEGLCMEERDMKKIVEKSLRIGRKGDVVLLSPACTSLDLYKNFEERGKKFQQEVFLLKK